MIDDQISEKNYQGEDMNDLVSRLTFSFVSEQRENEFRQSILKRNIALARNILFFLSILMPIFLVFDPLIIKPEFQMSGVIGIRLFFSGYCILMLFILGKVKSFNTYHRIMIVFMITVFTYTLGMTWVYQNHYALFTLYDVLIILGFYAAGFLPFISTVIICMSYTVAVFMSSFFYLSFDFHTQGMIILSYMSANLAGLPLAMQKHLSMREDYNLRLNLKSQALALQEMAYRDTLTEVYNRRALKDHFPQYLRSAVRARESDQGVYFILADIDHFKEINDTFGHEAGDQVLVEFSKLISTIIRPTDGFYRFGGEEFLIVLVYCDEAVAKARIDEIIATLNQHGLGIKETTSPVTSSFGMTRLQLDESMDSVIGRADRGLYQAKNSGRNQLAVIK